MSSRNQDSLRTRVAIDGHDFYLTSGSDLTDVMSRIQNIARTESVKAGETDSVRRSV